jgi:hypothetical protein
MNAVNKLPLSRLLTPRGDATRMGDIGAESIRELLRRGAVRFVVADVGSELRWVPQVDCFELWKRELQPHLAEPDQLVRLDAFPGCYAYFASQWDDGAEPIVLLSKTH